MADYFKNTENNNNADYILPIKSSHMPVVNDKGKIKSKKQKNSEVFENDEEQDNVSLNEEEKE